MQFTKLFALGVCLLTVSKGAEEAIFSEPSSQEKVEYQNFLEMSGFKAERAPLSMLEKKFSKAWIASSFYPNDAPLFLILVEADFQYAWALFKQGTQRSFDNALKKMLLPNSLDQPLSEGNKITVNFLKLYILYHYMVAIFSDKDRFLEVNREKVQRLKNSGVKIWNKLANSEFCRFNADSDFSLSCIGVAMITQSFIYRIEAYYSFLKKPGTSSADPEPQTTPNRRNLLRKSAEEDRSILRELLDTHLKKFGDQKSSRLFAGVRRYLGAIESMEKEVVLGLQTGVSCVPLELEQIIFDYVDPVLKGRFQKKYHSLGPLLKGTKLLRVSTQSPGDIDPSDSIDELVAAIEGKSPNPKVKKRKNKPRRKKRGGAQKKQHVSQVVSTVEEPQKTAHKEPTKKQAWKVGESATHAELQGEWMPVGKGGKTKAPTIGIFEVPVEKPIISSNKNEPPPLSSPSVTHTDASSQSVGSSRGRTPSDESFSPLDDASWGTPGTPDMSPRPSPPLVATPSGEKAEKATSPLTPLASPPSISRKVALADFASAPEFVPAALNENAYTAPRYAGQIYKPLDAAPFEEPIEETEHEDNQYVKLYERLSKKATRGKNRARACVQIGNMWANGLVGSAGKQPCTALHWFVRGIWLEKDPAYKKRLQEKVRNYIHRQKWAPVLKNTWVTQIYSGLF